MACEIDESALPFLTGCPGPNEWIVVGNAVGGLDMNGGQTVGYGRRLWKDMMNCILQGMTFVPVQFIIGQPGSLLPPGGVSFHIAQTNVIHDSLLLSLDGGVLDRDDNTQISYHVDWDEDGGGFTITLNQGANNLQTYMLYYAHS